MTKTWWLVPFDLAGRKIQFAAKIDGRLPVPEYTGDCSFRIGPFQTRADAVDWASDHPLYHGHLWDDTTGVRVLAAGDVPDVTVTPEYLEHWWNLGTPELVLQSLADGPKKELLRLLIDC